jgi:hypothetical protein
MSTKGKAGVAAPAVFLKSNSVSRISRFAVAMRRSRSVLLLTVETLTSPDTRIRQTGRDVFRMAASDFFKGRA